jgi:hypothetical protein
MLCISLLLICASLFTSIEASAQSRSGTYRNKYGELKIQSIQGEPRSFNFSIAVGNPTPPMCIGNLKGKAKWLEENIAEYNSDFKQGSCRLTFIFSGDRVIVRETNCGEEHGASCSFEGTFIRTRRNKSRSSLAARWNRAGAHHLIAHSTLPRVPQIRKF